MEKKLNKLKVFFSVNWKKKRHLGAETVKNYLEVLNSNINEISKGRK